MVLLIPVGVEYRTRRYPVVTFFFLGLCTVIYLLTLAFRLALGPAVTFWVHAHLWLTPANLLAQPWTLLTSMLVHADFFHLLGNMVFLFLFGACVEDLLLRPRFVALFVSCGLLAELVHIAASPEHFSSLVPLGGASGAISGCIGAFLLLEARRRIEFRYLIWFWFRFWSDTFFLPAWVVISCWFLDDLLHMILNLAVSHPGGGVAFAAHVGGTLAGLAFVFVERRFKRPVLPQEEDNAEEARLPDRSHPARQLQTPSRPPIRVQVRPRTATEAAAPAASTEPATVYLCQNGAQTGPFTTEQVQQMFRHQHLSGDTLYWQEGMEDWRDVEELRPPGTS